MPRIRVGLIGLSTTSTLTNWAARSHLPYLQSPQGLELFEIVALCNSSVASAKKSIEHYKLDSSIKTYDSPADLAADPTVDLVVNVTGVEHHYKLLLPVVQAGKNVYTELPLAVEMSEMQELVRTAKEKKVKTVFGMQGQNSPVTKLLRNMISEGKIGKVLSTTWTGFSEFPNEKPLPIALRVFTERKLGANIMTVNFLHTFNYIIATLGELDTFQSMLGNQRPSMDLMDPSQGGKVVETVQKDTPDQILLQGRFADSGAFISYHLRSGGPFAGHPGVVWAIYGEKGEIRVTCKTSALDILHEGIKISLHEFGKENQPQDIELPKDGMSDLEGTSENVGRIYEAYAKGGECPDWKMGLKRHELIEEMYKRADSGKPFGEPVTTA